MTTATTTGTTTATTTRAPARAATLTVLWAAVTATAALAATVTGSGYPFGAADGHSGTHALADLPARLGAPLLAGLAVAVALVGLVLAGRRRPPTAWRTAILGVGWTAAALLLVVIPDVRLLTVVGYTPMLIVGLPFGWPPVDFGAVFTGALAAMVWSVAGGFLLVRALLRWQRRTAGVCEACARPARPWMRPAAAARWGRWAAWTAAAVPLVYATTRFAWAFGIPLGISADFLAEIRSSGVVWGGVGLAAFATVGAILTTGLVYRWGEVFPRWMVGLAGRRVPVRLAVVPATVVATLVMSASLSFLIGAFDDMGHLVTSPMVLWPLWSAALGVATWAYHLRRRGTCATCAAGGPGSR
jgi:hypothetical protein